MSNTVQKVDGIGTRKDGSGGEKVNRNQGARFIRLYAKASVARGDCLALSIDSAIDGTDSTDYGYGNIVQKADRGEALFQQVIGVATESVTVTGTAYELVQIQVAGRCEFVKAKSASDTNPGVGLVASENPGECEDIDSSDLCLPFAICLEDGSGSATADTKAYLINPLNL